MKKINKNYKQISAIFLTIMTAALLAAGILYYINDMQNSLWNQAVSEILEVTSQGSRTFEVYLEKDMQTLARISLHLAQENPENEAAILDIIDTFKDTDNNSADFAVVDLNHGILYADASKTSRALGANELTMYGSFAKQGIREPYMGEDMGKDTGENAGAEAGQKMVGSYQRFLFADGTHGIVELRRPASAVADEFMLSFYNNTGFSYIINRQGEILIRASHKNVHSSFSNIAEVIESSGNSQEEIKAFSDKMSLEKEGVLQLVFDGEKNVCAFAPIHSTDGWYLVAIVPNSVIMKYADKVLKSSQTFLILLGCIFIITGCFIYMEQWSHKKIMKKESDVQHRECLFSILANNTNDVFLMFSTTDYAVEYVSPNVERVIGVPIEQVRANIRTVERSTADESKKDIIYDSVKKLKVGEFVLHEGERIHKQNGAPRWFMETIYKIAMADMEGSERYIAVLSDRTHERRSEQTLKDALDIAKTANEAKSAFLSNMSHDIRTPMNAIMGFSTLLQRDAHDPEKVQEYTRKIAASSQHLLGLINDVLDMSKIESGKTTLNISELSLAAIMDELGAIIQPQAKAKQQDFKIYVYDICNEQLLGDRLRINQILINILSNAVKYTPEGGKITMTVRQMPQYSQKYAHFHFVIRDNGIGMSKEFLGTIFQSFSRESNQKTANIQGTGLGMAITKNLVDLMGGTIEVESEPDKGSTFILDLELRIQKEDIDPDFWKKHGIAHLLVVDDNEETCVGIKNAMVDTGVSIQYALNGKTAVQMAKDASAKGKGFDVVVIDWKMPDIDGIETARRIRKIVPSYVPVMILTAYDISDIEEEGLAAGIDSFLPKPFFLSNFRSVINGLKKEENAESKTEEQDNPLAGKNILAAEDNELNAEILLELLEMTGVNCELASNGQEALTKFEQSSFGQYDVILMDVQMPTMDGYEATKAIRSCSHPQAKTIPIIAMTANAFSEDVKEALDAGMNAHVAKPIDMEHLQTVIKEIMA